MPPIFAGHLSRRVEIDVEQRDLGAGLRERGRGLGAEPGRGAGHDGGVSFGIHELSSSRSRSRGRMPASHKAPPPARRGALSTARWLIEPLSVASPASSEGGSAIRIDPADAVRAAGALLRQRVQPLAELVAHFGVAQHRGGRRLGRQARRACGRPRRRETPAPRCRRGRRRRSPRRAPAARNDRRTARAARRSLTQVPLASLKSSASRPSNSRPLAGSAGSTNFSASPIL